MLEIIHDLVTRCKSAAVRCSTGGGVPRPLSSQLVINRVAIGVRNVIAEDIAFVAEP